MPPALSCHCLNPLPTVMTCQPEREIRKLPSHFGSAANIRGLLLDHDDENDSRAALTLALLLTLTLPVTLPRYVKLVLVDCERALISKRHLSHFIPYLGLETSGWLFGSDALLLTLYTLCTLCARFLDAFPCDLPLPNSRLPFWNSGNIELAAHPSGWLPVSLSPCPWLLYRLAVSSLALSRKQPHK